MRFFSRSIMGVFLTAVTVGLLALAVQVVAGAMQARLAGGRVAPEAAERVISANVITVESGRITPVLRAFGEVRSTRTLLVRSSVGGTVVEVAAGLEDGASVAVGQVLVRLDPADATSARDLVQAAVAEAVAEQAAAAADADFAGDDLVAAEAQAALRAQALARQEDLLTRGAGSAAAAEDAALMASQATQAVLGRRQAVLRAQARVQTAANARARAEISLRDAERVLQATVIRAAFAGRLNGVAVVLGGLVSPNEVLAEVIDPAALEVAVRLSTAQLAQLGDAGATPLRVYLDAAGDQFVSTGDVTRVAAAVGDGESGRLVYGTIATPGPLRPGDFVSVWMDQPEIDNAAVLPATAVSADGRVLAVGGEERLEELSVVVLARQGDDVIVAADGLGGRDVVAERSPLLGAGIRVAPVRLTEKVGG
jgi:multidrug efflux pump subunit AcrA (membrane-fusion protein)